MYPEGWWHQRENWKTTESQQSQAAGQHDSQGCCVSRGGIKLCGFGLLPRNRFESAPLVTWPEVTAGSTELGLWNVAPKDVSEWAWEVTKAIQLWSAGLHGQSVRVGASLWADS